MIFNKAQKMLLFMLILTEALVAQSEKQEYVRYSAPEMFTYKELVSLSLDQPIESALAKKLEVMTTTPFLSNEAYYQGVRPITPKVDGLGRVLRVALWNAERGVHLDEIILLFTNGDRFIAESQEDRLRVEKEKQKAEPNDQEEMASLIPIDINELREDIELLQSADIVILNEVDWGMPRSGYREVIAELGRELQMNWAWCVEFVEIDPVVLGTDEQEAVEGEEKQEDSESLWVEVDKKHLHALHGTAILSRYPIRRAVAKPFEIQPYDWYEEEKALRPFEKGIRAGSTFIGSELNREMRRGGRTTLAVELFVPDLPEGLLTVLSPHLENRTKPENRLKQMQEVLDWIQDINNPVIIAGDLNTTGGDAQSWKLERQIIKSLTSADFYVSKGLTYATGAGVGYDVFKFGFNLFKNQNDPTVQHIPYFSPNKERKFFNTLADYRFHDGKAFDFRGDPERTINGAKGTLANSNARGKKGFVPTYEFVITISNLFKHKLDWIFVKSYLESARDQSGPYRFAPHRGETMKTINSAYSYILSDHHPMTVDLPFREPELIEDKKD